jgi:catalase
MMTYMYLDSGTPQNYRQMDGYGVHAFRWVNAQGKVVFVKYKWTSMQGYLNTNPAHCCCRAGEGPPGSHRRPLSRGGQG